MIRVLIPSTQSAEWQAGREPSTAPNFGPVAARPAGPAPTALSMYMRKGLVYVHVHVHVCYC